MRKAAVGLLCLLCRTVPLASSELVFERTYDVPRPFGGSETVTVKLTTANEPVVVQPDPADPTRIRIFAKTNTALTISKYEESGGYAHGIDWWVNGDGQGRLLYSFNSNGSAALGTFPSGTTVELQLYRINVFFYEGINPLYRIVTRRDATGPAFTLSPAPGAYPSVVVTAAPTDAGVGLGDPSLVTTFSVARASTSDIVATGRGTSVAIEEEGAWNVSFIAPDLLGNVGSCPSGTSPPNTYIVDRSPPVVSDVEPGLRPRMDGALDFNLAFTLGDTGVGVSLVSLRVDVACVVGGVKQWTRVLGQGDLDIDPADGGVTVALPVLVVPRSSLLQVDIIAADALGNARIPEALSLTYAMPPAPLHASVLDPEVTAEAIAAGPLLVARYRVPLALDRARDALRSDGVARYRVTRTLQTTGEVETVVDLAPAAFADLFEDRDGIAMFTDTMEGGRYAHQSISYAIETVFSAGGSESVVADGVARMPNIEAWQVRVMAGGKLLQEYRSGAPSYPELRVRTLAGLTAEIDRDPEGDELAARLEASGPGGITGSWPPTGWASTIAFEGALPDAPDGVYQARFIVSEVGSDQPMTSPWFTIVVDRNYGEIDGDVVWSTDQVMTGSIVIKPGARLTVASGVRVSVARAIDPATGEGLSISVEPGGTLVLSPGAIVQPIGWQPDAPAGAAWVYWAGIVVEGTAAVTGGAIRGAARGVVAMPGSNVTVRDARIEACRTGVHAVGVGVEPEINATWFVGCARYGIKEDEGAVPVVTDCVFDRNTYDYYDTVLTAIAAEDIDVLQPGHNHGNRSGGGTP